MVIAELQMDIACPEACFQAESAQDCLYHLQIWMAPGMEALKLPVLQCVRRICQEAAGEDLAERCKQLDTINMFVLISGAYTYRVSKLISLTASIALHLIVFNLRTTGVDSDYLAIKYGLANWKTAWNDRDLLFELDISHNILYQPWKRLGFMQHATEYWMLAHMIIEQYQNSQPCAEFNNIFGTTRLLQYDEPDMKHMNVFIQESLCFPTTSV